MSSNSAGPALNQGAGYGVVLGFGFAFAIFMVAIHHAAPTLWHLD